MRSAALALSLLAACGSTDDDDPWAPFSPTLQDRVIGLVRQDAPPADPTNAYAERADAAALGQFLYFDPRLSAGYLRADAQAKDVSCATCHAGDLGLADGLALAVGQAEVTRNAPTVLNTAFNRWFFWDGRADSHWSQALGPLENPLEHGVSREEVVAFVRDDAEIAAAYTSVYGRARRLGQPPDGIWRAPRAAPGLDRNPGRPGDGPRALPGQGGRPAGERRGGRHRSSGALRDQLAGAATQWPRATAAICSASTTSGVRAPTSALDSSSARRFSRGGISP